MAWVTTGEPTIERQRRRWVVRVAGYDAATGRRRLRHLGTHATKKVAVPRKRAIMDVRVPLEVGMSGLYRSSDIGNRCFASCLGDHAKGDGLELST